MSKFDINSNFQSHKFDASNTHKHGITSSQLAVAMSSSIPIWELEKLTESEYYIKHPITPAWEILNMSKEDWEESLKPKVYQSNLNESEITSKEETKPEIQHLDTILEDMILDTKEKQPVKEKVDKLEKKLKTITKTKSNKWN
jgi:hypothetical protein